RQQSNARGPFVISRQSRSREKCFDAPAFPAITSTTVVFGLWPWERVVPPLSGNAVRTAHDSPVDDNPSPDSCPRDDAEHDLRAGTRTVSSLGHREAICVVCDANWPAKALLEVLLKGSADEPGGVRVFDQPRGWRNDARNTYADG